ncbi:DEAD/DEAH box helicase [Flaviaesturariibacter flavus]|uniref:DEAD/DEAH box helicase n=1 Tax=Flaviaesturariibacter flavus TaxID=2502780 RepID=A0A4R1BIG7_9BACT|nr:type I restriction endonuclease subunit R [Flaviaesturariibacter flavus]TCJ17069.1 DEAD/DEAH box helicase [Flaviaesturariibacter flavus]
MNEAETRAELIDPQLKEAGWDSKADPEVKVHREYHLTAGKIRAGGGREKPLIADYLLAYRGRKLAVVEAKSDERVVGEGVAQAKAYALKLQLDNAYAANGKEIYYINLDSPHEGTVPDFHSPQQLWDKAFPTTNDWQDKFDEQPAEDKGGTMGGRFYQELAVERALDAIAQRKDRILLTLATGTGKTFIAFQIAWKLFHTRWNRQYDGARRPRILFLADRNILANQAFNAFSAFPEDALVRIKPNEIKKQGRVPINGALFFTIFQTFMSGKDKEGNPVPYFGQYPPDYFDLIIVDECHRGGANDESTWRAILEYFAPAVQIGLTATPKRTINADTYKYFGEPVFIYSLKDGINDGFLTPFKVKQIRTSLDEYTYTSDDNIVEGEIEEGKTYTEKDFNRTIEIVARERKRVEIFMGLIDRKEKAIIFCATQEHAALVRDLINQVARNPNLLYCVRVTANDGELGEGYLRDFQDNEKNIPTILTTSQKLSTGVDARNVRNIVLLRPVNNIVEFKQIVGRGTRLFDGKNFFTIYDFVNASERFNDPEWDGEPIEPVEIDPKPKPDPVEPEPNGVEDPPGGYEPVPRPKKVKVKLANGKEVQISHQVSTTFMGPDGKPMSVQEFLNSLYGKLPELFKSEEELRRIWSNPMTRKVLLGRLAEAGFDRDAFASLQKAIDAEHSDIFDVLEFISYSRTPITREERATAAKTNIHALLSPEQREFIDFVLHQYVQAGVDELDQEQLPHLLELKYNEVSEAAERLGGVARIRELFVGFQKELYSNRTA